MKLDNHIARRFLIDPDLSMEIIESTYGDKFDENIEQAAALHMFLSPQGNKTYFVTNTVIDKLEMLDAKKAMSAEGWKVFEQLPDFKKTFILPDNRCIRVDKSGGFIRVGDMQFTFDNGSKDSGELYWVLYWVNMSDGILCSHFESNDVHVRAPFLYSLLCFMELTENTEVEVMPGQRYGTRKEGKIINSLKESIIVVNSCWNIKIIRTEGFPVRGHAAIRWTGEGRSIAKLVYIEPYQKTGYSRQSGKELHA